MVSLKCSNALQVKMRNKKIIKNTMDSQVYKKAMRVNQGCSICGPNKGCNRNRDNDRRCWKTYRNKQWE